MTNDNKQYPNASPEIAKMFGIGPEEREELPAEEENHGGHTAEAPSHLPVVDLPVTKTGTTTHKTEADFDRQIARDLEVLKSGIKSEHSKSHGNGSHNVEEEMASTNSFWKNILKTVVPYFLIFVLAVFVFIFFFSKVDIGNLFKSGTQTVSVQESAIQELQKQGLTEYNKWMLGYYYSVSDVAIIDPNADNSGNGLSNFQKYLLNLNPKSYDTLGLGMADSETLAKGVNPLSGNPLTSAQKSVIEKYFDMEVVMNKLALAKLHNTGRVAGSTVFSGQVSPRGSGTYSTFQNNSTPTPSPSAQVAPMTGANLGGTVIPTYETAGNVLSQNDLDINMDIPGRLQIPSLKVDAPIIWSKDPSSFEQDLKSGVIHYPGTAVPGQIGTTYISGHSSNYAWVKGNYNKVFTKLNDLKDNGSFSVTVTLKNGNKAILHYVVTGRKEYQPTDVAQFANSGKSVVALSTCWPVGSTAKRLVVFGELTQIER